MELKYQSQQIESHRTKRTHFEQCSMVSRLTNAISSIDEIKFRKYILPEWIIHWEFFYLQLLFFILLYLFLCAIKKIQFTRSIFFLSASIFHSFLWLKIHWNDSTAKNEIEQQIISIFSYIYLPILLHSGQPSNSKNNKSIEAMKSILRLPKMGKSRWTFKAPVWAFH